MGISWTLKRAENLRSSKLSLHVSIDASKPQILTSERYRAFFLGHPVHMNVTSLTIKGCVRLCVCLSVTSSPNSLIGFQNKTFKCPQPVQYYWFKHLNTSCQCSDHPSLSLVVRIKHLNAPSQCSRIFNPSKGSAWEEDIAIAMSWFSFNIISVKVLVLL